MIENSPKERKKSPLPDFKFQNNVQNLLHAKQLLQANESHDKTTKEQLEILDRALLEHNDQLVRYETMDTPSKKVRILSLDGGGIRGLLTAAYLNRLELALGRDKDPDVRLCDFFDMMAGTSAGAILVCCYLVPQNGTNRPMNAEEAMNIYRTQHTRVFYKGNWGRFWAAKGILAPKYDHDGIEGLLEEKVGNTQLSQLLKPAFLTTYDCEHGKPVIFGSLYAKFNGPDHDYYIKDICRASSAAPTYFQDHNFKSVSGKTSFTRMIDGGVFANNVAMVAFAAAQTIYFDTKRTPTPRDILLISVGTGAIETAVKNKLGGAVSWMLPIIEVVFAGSADIADYTVRTLFNANNMWRNYFRIQPDLANTGVTTPIDDTSPQNLRALQDLGEKIAREGLPKPSDAVAFYDVQPVPEISLIAEHLKNHAMDNCDSSKFVEVETRAHPHSVFMHRQHSHEKN